MHVILGLRGKVKQTPMEAGFQGEQGWAWTRMSARNDRLAIANVYASGDHFSAAAWAVSGVLDPPPGPEALSCTPDECGLLGAPRRSRGNSSVTPSRLAPCLVLPRDPLRSGVVSRRFLSVKLGSPSSGYRPSAAALMDHQI